MFVPIDFEPLTLISYHTLLLTLHRLYDEEQIGRLKAENSKQLAAQMEKLKADNATQLAALKLDAQTRESAQQRALAERLEKRRKAKANEASEVSSLGHASSGKINASYPDAASTQGSSKLISLPPSTAIATPAATTLTPWNDVDF